MSGGRVVPDHEDFDENVVHFSREPEFYSVAGRKKRGQSTRDWLIEDMIPRRAVVILSGWSSTGKTHIVNDLAFSVAFGEPFAGYEVVRRCGSLMFAAEGQDDVLPRWDVLDIAKIQPWREAHGEPFDPSQIICWTEQIPRLDGADALKEYSAKIERLNAQQRMLCGSSYPGLGLVTIDTMAAAAELTDDQHNAAGTNQKIFNMLHAIARKYDCAVLVTDHLGKDASKGTRGSGAKEASADVVLTVTGTVNDDGICSNTAMTIKKLRGGAANKRIVFGLQEVKMPLDPDGRRQDGVVVKWEVASGKLRDGKGPAKQNKRHALLMRALDRALIEATPKQWQWVSLGRDLNFKAVDETLVRTVYKVSAPATGEDGEKHAESVRKAYKRAMTDSSIYGVIGQKTLEDGRIVVWRTDYIHPDSSRVSR